MASAVPCPMVNCEGAVFVRRIGDFKAFGCDGPEHHTDPQVRYAMISQTTAEIADNRAEMDEIERWLDPVAWLQDRLDEARRDATEKFQRESLFQREGLPSFATGFTGRENGALLGLRGMTTLSGIASSGKSWFALGAALNSALDGWDVHYLAAEANDVIGRRVFKAYGQKPPESFTLHSVEPGVTAADMMDEIREWVVSTKTLLVIDSISTLLGLMSMGGGRKVADKWEAQSDLEMFLMRVRALTHGAVSIINISEANARGETKGRALDHRSDVAINFKSLEDSDAKEIRVMKAWEGSTGLIGRARVDPVGPGLELIYEGAKAYEGEPEGEEDGF